MLKRLLFAAVVLALAPIRPVRAQFPMGLWPDCGRGADPGAGCPNDLNRTWNLISYIKPEIADNRGFREAELAMGSGLHADRAWQITTGRPDTLIAVTDSGIQWDSLEVVNKHFLNRGELPKPMVGEAEAEDYDANGDGLFNIRDYEFDFRVAPTAGVDAADSMLDPSDLIHTFSDGIDDDANGYIDDVAGWDFFWDDNDPYDDTRYGHGTGEAKDSSAEGHNGREELGVCPNCMILNLRAGDSFVCNVDNFGLAALYAVDMGAHVIQSALGTLNNTRLSQQAVEYAYRKGVVLLASAADETSMHHNYPSVNNHAIYIHANVFDSQDEGDRTTTYLNFSNCTNYGGRLVLSAPSTGCSSGATGIGSGVAGLLVSRAADQGMRLTPEEIKQILTLTADDIHVPESAADPTKHLSLPGWDQRFGYGRLNARSAAEAVAPGEVPPEADLVDPDWFQVIYPSRTPTVPLIGHLRADRSTSFDYIIEYAVGIEPGEDEWVEIASGASAQPMGSADAPVILAEWDVTEVDLDPDKSIAIASDTFRDVVDQFTVTLRLRVTDAGGRSGEMRKTVALHEDPDLLPGFPMDLGASIEASQKMDDLDGDGALELIVVSSDGWVRVLDAQGEDRPGWPRQLGLEPALDPANPANHRAAPAFRSGAVDPDFHQSTISAPAIGDLDGDGSREIVLVTLRGSVYVYGGDGALRAGWPQGIRKSAAELSALNDPEHLWERGFRSLPALADMDGDGTLEVIVGGMDGHLYVWRHDGAALRGFPIEVHAGDAAHSRIFASPAVGDITGDGVPEIVIPTNETTGADGRVFAVSNRGSENPGGAMLPGWPIVTLSVGVLPVVGEGIPQAPAMADLDGDGALEVAVLGIAGAGEIYNGAGERLYTMDTTITDRSQTRELTGRSHINDATLADLTGDGVPELIFNMMGLSYLSGSLSGGLRNDSDYLLAAFDIREQTYLPGWPRLMTDHQFFVNASVADITGDGVPEVLAGSGGYLLHAYDTQGRIPEGWPKFTSQWIVASPAVGDLDCDGFLEVAASTRAGRLYVWKTRGLSNGNVQWASHRGNNLNDGRWDLSLQSAAVCANHIPSPGDDDDDDDDTAQPPDPEDGDDGAGCSCRTLEPDRPVGIGDVGRWVLLFAPLFWRVRRRTARPLAPEPRAG